MKEVYIVHGTDFMREISWIESVCATKLTADVKCKKLNDTAYEDAMGNSYHVTRHEVLY